jgi:hypothetical protein
MEASLAAMLPRGLDGMCVLLVFFVLQCGQATTSYELYKVQPYGFSVNH